MPLFPEITNLTSSWTKFDSVKTIQFALEGEFNTEGKIVNPGIDEPTLKKFLGINTLNDILPNFWKGIYNYPDQVGLFALIAAITTHHENIKLFANEYNEGNMQGVMYMDEGKHFTNLRSALVESGASENIFRRKQEIPYDFSKLFEEGEVGKLMRSLLEIRLTTIGYKKERIKDDFFSTSFEVGFEKVLGLTKDQFTEWISGNGISNSLYELIKNDITYEKYGRIKALKVKQWLKSWDNVSRFDEKNRAKPEAFFYQFNIPALLLKRIYDIHSRRAFSGRKDEPYSQRKHSEQRSNEIREYVKGGFPWSTISEVQRENDNYKNLQMPGWLPTSIIANILAENSERKSKKIDVDCVIKIKQIDDNFADIVLPEKIWSTEWLPIVSPIEIIDGQHRVKAFDRVKDLDGNFEFPVVAFSNLDFTWQAYLFYTINIKPKRINTSLAYDLMPLLRIQDWLDQDLSGPEIYKKVRAQELTELLWSSDISPWKNRINMLGETGEGKSKPVSQNSFINSLTTSFVKKWDGKIGGLYGGELHEGEQDIIQWDKETQAAFLILIWDTLNNSIKNSNVEWIIDLRGNIVDDLVYDNKRLDLAFVHPHSFLTTDQGIRPILFIFNDLCFLANDYLELNKFNVDIDYEKFTTSIIIELIVDAFRKHQTINRYIIAISEVLINDFDWRTPSAFDTKDPSQDVKRQHQNQFKGSGGYKEMRMQLLKILINSKKEVIAEKGILKLSEIALLVQSKLGY